MILCVKFILHRVTYSIQGQNMTYEERRSIISVFSTVLINAVYAAVMLPHLPTTGNYTPEIFNIWGTYMLVLIPVTVIAKIIIIILFVIVSTATSGEYVDELVDQREELIIIKSSHITEYLIAIGFIVANG